jgi:hypothetical protein
MANGIKISEETFDGLKDTDTKLHAIFKAVVATNKNICNQVESCEPRFRKLEKRKWIDKGLAVFMGAIAGFFGGLFKSP